MNVIARLEYELAYYDSAVHRFMKEVERCQGTEGCGREVAAKGYGRYSGQRDKRPGILSESQDRQRQRERKKGALTKRSKRRYRRDKAGKYGKTFSTGCLDQIGKLCSAANNLVELVEGRLKPVQIPDPGSL